MNIYFIRAIISFSSDIFKLIAIVISHVFYHKMPTHHLNAEEQTAHTQIRPVPICKFVRRLHTVKPWDDPS